MPLPERSAIAGLPGVPWWGALGIAVGCTALGAIIDLLTDSTTLTGSFNWMYALGCLAAALLVAHRGLFTAAVQPSLILFVAVPTTTWLLSPAQQSTSKTLLLLVVPLISRFPWMAWVSALALLVCLVRWGLWHLAQRRERIAAQKKTARASTIPPRRPSSVPPPRRPISPPASPQRHGSKESPVATRTGQRSEQRHRESSREQFEQRLPTRAPAGSRSNSVRPKIDPRNVPTRAQNIPNRGQEGVRYVPARSLPTRATTANSVRTREDSLPRSGAANTMRAGKHALPPARIPLPPEVTQPPRRRRYEETP